jgi:hypothetical protein
MPWFSSEMMPSSSKSELVSVRSMFLAFKSVLVAAFYDES